jgi:hypothetical protein
MRALGGSGQRWALWVHAQVRLARHEGHERCTLGCGPNLEVPGDLDRAPGSELVSGEVSPRRGSRRRITGSARAFSNLLDGCLARSDHVSGRDGLLTRSRGGVRHGRWTGIVARASGNAQCRQNGDGARLHAHVIYDGWPLWWVHRSTLIGMGGRFPRGTLPSADPATVTGSRRTVGTLVRTSQLLSAVTSGLCGCSESHATQGRRRPRASRRSEGPQDRSRP